jgi:hypothetical protein
MPRTLLVMAVCAMGAWLPARASACLFLCTDHVLPAGTRMLPAHLPANGVFVRIPGGGVSVTSANVERLRDGVVTTSTLELTAEVVAIPDVAVSDLFTVTATVVCAGATDAGVTVIRVMPEAPVPTTLGVLAVDAPMRGDVDVLSSACASPLASSVAHYGVALDAALLPWADALEQTTMLDGAPWHEPAYVTPAGERFVFAHCVTPALGQTVEDASLGEHRLQVVAALRGLDGTLSTNEDTFVLTCASAGSGCSIPPGGAPPHGVTPWLVVLVAALFARGFVTVARRPRT